ncbi:MAG: type II toxin-antitoxin system PemK/MazF family toxin [Labilithrix sp.]|nr:type II toxin-antitoxin system PemK/MazF family toxin [Labilithrix sp.]
MPSSGVGSRPHARPNVAHEIERSQKLSSAFVVSAKRGDVLAVRRRIGFGIGDRRERFVVLQSDVLPADLETVIVAPLDDDLPLYAPDPLVVRVSRREAGSTRPQVVLVSHLTSVLRERFDSVRVGRLRAASMKSVDRLAMIVLEL